MLVEQLINLEKVRTDNLKFRIDLGDRVMDCWSVTQIIVYKGKLLKQSSDRKSKLGVLSTLVTTWLSNFAFHLRPIKLRSDLTAHFGCDRFRIMPEIVSKLLRAASEVAVLFDSNLSRRPFLGPALHRI